MEATYLILHARKPLTCWNPWELLQIQENDDLERKLYPDNAKIQKQMKYADAKGIPFVVLAGENEMDTGTFTLKNMKNGTQNIVTLEDICRMIKNENL
jgi:histidyl-tRNA synthetase